MKKVLLAIPTGGNLDYRIVEFMLDMIRQKKYDVSVHISKLVGVEANRNQIVKAFLNSKCEYLLMVDTDNPPFNNPLPLIEEDKDIIGLPTPINVSNIPGMSWFAYNIYKDGKQLKDGEGLEKVDEVGTGCVIIKREVFEKLGDNPFTPERYEDDRIKVGEDIMFCRRAKEKGIEIWTHWDYKCRHYKEIDLSSIPTEMFNKLI